MERNDDNRISDLIDSWSGIPALVHDRHLNVVAANPIARNLVMVEPGDNLVRLTYLHPELRRDHDGWPDIRDDVAQALKDSLDRHDEDGEFLNIVGELASTSQQFAEAWAHLQPARSWGTHRHVHRIVGEMWLTFQRLLIPDDRENVVVAWRPADLDSADSLARLARLVDGATE